MLFLAWDNQQHTNTPIPKNLVAVSSRVGYLDCVALFRICRFSHAWRRFPLARVFQWVPATLQKRRHACKSHRMRNGAAQSK